MCEAISGVSFSGLCVVGIWLAMMAMVHLYNSEDKTLDEICRDKR